MSASLGRCRCSVCADDDTDLEMCKTCDVHVHRECCFSLDGKRDPDSDFQCPTCQGTVEASSTCILCGHQGGLLFPTAEHGWAHGVCCTYLPGVFLQAHPSRAILVAQGVPRAIVRFGGKIAYPSEVFNHGSPRLCLAENGSAAPPPCGVVDVAQQAICADGQPPPRCAQHHGMVTGNGAHPQVAHTSEEASAGPDAALARVGDATASCTAQLKVGQPACAPTAPPRECEAAQPLVIEESGHVIAVASEIPFANAQLSALHDSVAPAAALRESATCGPEPHEATGLALPRHCIVCSSADGALATCAAADCAAALHPFCAMKAGLRLGSVAHFGAERYYVLCEVHSCVPRDFVLPLPASAALFPPRATKAGDSSSSSDSSDSSDLSDSSDSSQVNPLKSGRAANGKAARASSNLQGAARTSAACKTGPAHSSKAKQHASTPKLAASALAARDTQQHEKSPSLLAGAPWWTSNPRFKPPVAGARYYGVGTELKGRDGRKYRVVAGANHKVVWAPLDKKGLLIPEPAQRAQTAASAIVRAAGHALPLPRAPTATKTAATGPGPLHADGSTRQLLDHEVDKKLWVGAASSGWRIVAAERNGKGEQYTLARYTYTSPENKSFTSRLDVRRGFMPKDAQLCPLAHADLEAKKGLKRGRHGGAETASTSASKGCEASTLVLRPTTVDRKLWDGAFLQGWRIIQSREQEATVDRCCLAPWGAIYKTSGKAVSASGPPPFDASGGPIPPATYPTVKLVLSRNGGDQKQAKVAQPACSPKPPHAPAKERKAAHNATANEQAPQPTKQSGAASDAKPAARKNGASSKKRQPILDLFD